MRIHDNKYKLGQKVGCVNLDNPQQILPGWVIGIDLSDDGREMTYTIADFYDELRNRFECIYDGVKESELRDEDAINSP